jgi:hypothetical protein
MQAKLSQRKWGVIVTLCLSINVTVYTHTHIPTPLFIYLFILVVLGIELRASHLLDKHSTT